MKIVAKKLLYLFFMLFIISLLSFFAIHAAPNSFLGAGELNPNMTEASLAQLKAIYGLDKSLFEQYTSWLKNLVQLEFGVSYVSGNSVSSEILKRVNITLFMNISVLFFSFLSAVYLGFLSALHNNSTLDKIIQKLSVVSFSMPSFYLSLVLILLLSVNLNLFPVSGLHSLGEKEGFDYYSDMLWHLTLPMFVMFFVGLGSMIIYVRALVLDILKSDYYYFACSRNLSQKVLFRLFILPNLLPQFITFLGLALPSLLGGSVILEFIFGIDGMGQLFYLSAMSRDYPVIMGILMISAALTLFGNIVADLTLLKLNPYSQENS